MTELIIRRRTVLTGLGGLILTGAIGAPVIARASSLMDINRLGNRLVVAYQGYWDHIYNHSKFNLTQLNSEDYIAWQYFHRNLKYSLQRRELIHHIPSAENLKWLKTQVDEDLAMVRRVYQRDVLGIIT
jgi:hypothetical protein